MNNDLFGSDLRIEGLIAGVDEAGRGPLAGPVVIAAVILDPRRPIDGLADSKVLNEKRRDALALCIREQALAFAVCIVERDEIDSLNILQATLVGMARAIAALTLQPALALIDGNQVPRNLACRGAAIIGGDASEPAISAASILAKTVRDRRMCELDTIHPGYGFARHKGYPTAEHFEALFRLGPCNEHRRSFEPVRRALQDAVPACVHAIQ